MTEIEKTPDLITGDDIGSNVLDHTLVADSFINVAASDPTVDNDTGQGYVVGSLWVNSTSGDVFQAIGVDAESAQWANQEGDDVNISPAWQGLSYAYEVGGGNVPGYGDEMSRWSITAPYAAADIGTLPHTMSQAGTAVKGSTIFLSGGYSGPLSSTIDEISTYPAAASASTTDIGEAVNEQRNHGSGWSTTRGYCLSGQDDSSPAINTIMDYSLSSPLSTSDVAEGAAAKQYPASCDSETHTFITGGWSPGPSAVDNIYMYEKATTNNSTDVGEVTMGNKYGSMGNSDNVNGYGFISGGGSPEVDSISRFAFASPAPSTDVGEHASPFVAYGGSRGMSSPTYGHTVSRTTSPTNEVKERFAFSSPTSGADIGEVAQAPDNVSCACV